MLQTRSRADALTDAYNDVRSFTEELAAPLSAEDQVVQSMPDASPTKWHRAHTTWFFETFLLKTYLDGYEEVDPAYGYLFNSYYEAVGARHPRPDRGLISRPSVDEVADYRDAVDQAMVALLEACEGNDSNQATIHDLVELGLNHEQQHQELLLMDIKHVLSVNPINPLYNPRPTVDLVDVSVSDDTVAVPFSWTSHAGGEVTMGHDGNGFSFDNELPAHNTLVPAFDLADRVVTCGEWLEFMGDGGYDQHSHWLSDGWHAVQNESWHAPAYWYQLDGEWQIFTLSGLRPVDLQEPVVHVSHYEADAFARWAGARLPTECEWEHAAASHEVHGNFADSGHLHPLPAVGSGTSQLYGDVWEWTASAYLPYPGFETAEGAVGEYNGKFMSNQMVLRGGCCATPPGHARATYRNFFPPSARWMFGGLRLARSAR